MAARVTSCEVGWSTMTCDNSVGSGFSGHFTNTPGLLRGSLKKAETSDTWYRNILAARFSANPHAHSREGRRRG